MDELKYVQLETGRYALQCRNTTWFEADSVAFLLDTVSGVVIAHGHPEAMAVRYARMLEALLNSDTGRDKTEQLVLVQGQFTPEDLNRSIRQKGHLLAIYRVLESRAEQATTELIGRFLRSSKPAASPGV